MKVEVDDHEFRFSHGKAPRGFGSWAFSVVPPSEPNYLADAIWIHQATYGKARAEAVRQAKARGVDRLWTLS